jgi:hypothetical protein
MCQGGQGDNAQCCKDASKYVIEHNPHGVATGVCTSDNPRLPDVKKAEQQKRRYPAGP